MAKTKTGVLIPSVRFPKYKQLLLALIANLLISPFLSGVIGSILASLLLFYAIFTVIRSLELSKTFVRVLMGIALIALCLEVISILGGQDSAYILLIFLTQGIYSAFLTVSIYLIFREIYTTTRVTVDTLQGGICVYLMLGLLWALFYGMTSTIDPTAFKEPLLLKDGYTQITYFSYTTLTSLGYGDILPVSKLAQVLTNVEAIIGQLYPTIFIALLVGAYLSQRGEDS